MKPAVSVCIPVYGVEQYIERCVRSLFAQTMKDKLEFVFVDDCTPDKSIEILKSVLKEYPYRENQVKIIRHEKNGGLVAARKTGLSHASGEYIIHCDSDDWVEPDMYETMYKVAVESGADMVYCAYSPDDGNGHVKHCPVRKYNSVKELLQDATLLVALPTKLFRREIALSKDIYVPDKLCYGEDLLRVTQTILKCGTIFCCERSFYHYFRGNKNAYTSSFKREFLEQWIESIDFLSNKFPNQLAISKWQGEAMFQCIIRKLMLAREFRQLWKNERISVLKSKDLHVVKKIVILSACVSYSITALSCAIALKLRSFLKI